MCNIFYIRIERKRETQKVEIMNYILQQDNGTVKDGRCRDADRFTYYAGTGKDQDTSVDKVASHVDQITIFTESDFEDGVYVQGDSWEAVPVSKVAKRKGMGELID